MAKRPVISLTIEDMLTEIDRRRKTVTKLQRKRARLANQLAKLDATIRAAGGVVAKTASAKKPKRAGSGKRPKNAMTLPKAMAKVLSKDKPMSVAEIATAVAKAGYKSTSRTFKTIIYQALGRDRTFKRHSRGRYVLRGE